MKTRSLRTPPRAPCSPASRGGAPAPQGRQSEGRGPGGRVGRPPGVPGCHCASVKWDMKSHRPGEVGLVTPGPSCQLPSMFESPSGSASDPSTLSGVLPTEPPVGSGPRALGTPLAAPSALPCVDDGALQVHELDPNVTWLRPGLFHLGGPGHRWPFVSLRSSEARGRPCRAPSRPLLTGPGPRAPTCRAPRLRGAASPPGRLRGPPCTADLR